MLRVLVASFVFVLAGLGSAAANSCAPHCDWTHDYGPYDLSWVYPGLVGIPICDRDGNCSPHLVYRYTGPKPGITITVRPTHGPSRLLRRPEVR